jgi:transcription elongation factor GreB
VTGIMTGAAPNYITPAGLARLIARQRALFEVERPKIVEVVSWAAGNGDRSENGDYIYGRKRLREIDRELAHLSRRLKDAKVVDPSRQPDKTRAFFGATVTYANAAGDERTVTLVGEDETDVDNGCISWKAPLANALKGAAVGDVRSVRLPAGLEELEVIAITYPLP